VHRSLTTADIEAAYALAADKYASTEWMQRF
jgi:hypothetical protein